MLESGFKKPGFFLWHLQISSFLLVPALQFLCVNKCVKQQSSAEPQQWEGAGLHTEGLFLSFFPFSF